MPPSASCLCLVEFLRGPGLSFTLYKLHRTQQEADEWGAEQLRAHGIHGVRVFLCDLINIIEG